MTQYSYVRFKGTRTTYDTGDSTPTVEAITSSFFQYDGTTQDPYIYVGSAWGAFGGILYTFQKAEDGYGSSPPVTSAFGTTVDWSSPYNVPWRSHVFVSGSRFTTSGGYGLRIGNLDGSGYNVIYSQPFIGSQSFVARLPADTSGGAPERTARIDGEWEFSNDGSTVLFSWKGTDDDGNPYTG